MARVPYVDPADLPAEHREKIISQLNPGQPLHVYAALANNLDILLGFREYFSSLWSGSGLDEREREFVILAVADETGSAYEWHQHLAIAGTVGLTDDEIAAVETNDLAELADTEALLVRYARAVVRGAVHDALHDEVATQYDDSTVVGIASTASAYLGLARTLDALDVEVED